jgi:hypothetical protein
MAEIARVQRSKIKQVVLDLGEGDSLNISFDSNRVTKDMLERNQAEIDFSAVLAELISGWDLMEDGQALPITTEVIERLSIPIQAQIFQEIMRAAVPRSEEGNDSSATSFSRNMDSMGQPASPPNGQDPSSSPAPSASPSPS